MQRKLGVEVLWVFILSELLNGDTYAYDMAKNIKTKYGFDPGKVLPYVVLKRLEYEGLVESYEKDKRKYYRITERGRERLVEALKYIGETLEKLAEPLKSRGIGLAGKVDDGQA